ncbi:hypothetical protein VTK73DRAFT_310 [Phialemonium thermophilum]|uniref:Major facilitator superfamily (MFS) profile domain-containing protein n=1 Tax=Phialemonium thermophilum TaxID=223376 RepID=A0ABR3VVT0_9PEZI
MARPVFINLPFNGVSLAVLLFALSVHNPRTPVLAGLQSLDWIGSFLIVGGTICFLYGLQSGSGGTHSWSSPSVVCLLVFGVLILVLFGVYEHRFAQDPLVPTRIFSRRTNVAAFLVLCLHGIVFIAFDYFLPLYFQVALRLSPILSGVSLFAVVLPLSVATMATGWYIRRTQDYIWPVRVASALMTLGTGLFIDLGPTRDWAKIILFQLLAGLGAGPLFQAPMIAFQSHLPQRDIAAASSASMFLRSLCTSVSIVIGTVLLQRKLEGGQLTAEAGPEAQPGHYAAAMRTMWIFYAAVAGVMTCTGLLIEKAPEQEKRETTSVESETPT